MYIYVHINIYIHIYIHIHIYPHTRVSSCPGHISVAWIIYIYICSNDFKIESYFMPKCKNGKLSGFKKTSFRYYGFSVAINVFL